MSGLPVTGPGAPRWLEQEQAKQAAGARAQLEAGRLAREARARDELAQMDAAGLARHARVLRLSIGVCEDTGELERIPSLEVALRATEAALAVCEEGGAERLGDVPGWPAKLWAILGVDGDSGAP